MKLLRSAARRKMGDHRTYVGGVERGEYNITMLARRRFAHSLGISLNDGIGSIV